MVKNPKNPSYLRLSGNNGKSWQFRISVAPNLKEASIRVHASLKTRDLSVAQQKRDELIRKLNQRGLLTRTIQAKAKRAGII